jgi:hypothetical protein
MKFLAIALLTLSTSAFAETCPSVDKVIANAAAGRIEYNTPYDFSIPSAIAYANYCQIRKAGLKMCDTRLGLAKEMVKAARASFEIGEVNKYMILEWQSELAAVERECK